MRIRIDWESVAIILLVIWGAAFAGSAAGRLAAILLG